MTPWSSFDAITILGDKSVLHKSFILKKFTPVVSVSPAYTAEDQVGGVNLLTDMVAADGGTCLLQSVVVTDSAKQKAALTLYFFDDVPTITSVDNGAFDLLDAQLALTCIGHVLIPAANYQDSSSNSEATVTDVGLVLKSNAGHNTASPPAGSNKRSLWCVVKTTGTPTYAAVSDLTIKLGIEQH